MQLLVYEENHKFASFPEYDLNITKAKIIVILHHMLNS